MLYVVKITKPSENLLQKLTWEQNPGINTENLDDTTVKDLMAQSLSIKAPFIKGL